MVVCQDLIVLFNASRGCLFFWTILMIISLVWVIFMFIKKRIGENVNEQVYKQKKEEPTTYQINNPQQSNKKDSQYQKSQQVGSQNKQYDLKGSGSIEGGSSQPASQVAAVSQPQNQTSGLDKALFGYEQFLFNYIPFFVLNVLNIICMRSWAFNLVVWFLIMIPITVINLLGLFLKVENRFLQCFLKMIWVFVGVSWFINFLTTRTPCWNE